jgi:hypothetical protein
MQRPTTTRTAGASDHYETNEKSGVGDRTNQDRHVYEMRLSEVKIVSYRVPIEGLVVRAAAWSPWPAVSSWVIAYLLVGSNVYPWATSIRLNSEPPMPATGGMVLAGC